VKVTSFDSDRDLIIVPGRVWGLARDPIELRLVLDTGAAETIIVPEVIDDLGYNPREHAEQIAVMRSAVGREEGYMIRVARFACLGFQESDFRVHAQDLPEGWGIHGLVGLSFLRQLNYAVRSIEGRILVERAA
jgi:predicted aspartyl protease